MGDLSSTVQRLTLVKRACRRFLRLWAIQHAMEDSTAIDRLAADLEVSGNGLGAGDGQELRALLHRGGLCDD